MNDRIELDAQADDQTLLAQVVDLYHRTLKGSQDALDYLRRRGITSTESIDHFRIGYCDRTLGQHVPEKNKTDQTSRGIRERLERLGLVHGRGHEYFINFVVFPIQAADGSGRFVDIFGRRIFKNQHRRIASEKHLASQRCGVWNVEALAASEDLILCSSVFDALTFWQHGYRNVTCTFSPDTLPEDHLATIQRLTVRRVLTPCKRLAACLYQAGLECHLLHFPNGLDASVYALQVDDPKQSLGTVLHTAEVVDQNTDLSVKAAPRPEERSHEHDEERDDEPENAAPTRETDQTPPLLNADADDQKLLAQVVEYYQRSLKSSPEALDYLRGRGITHGQAIEQFRIGYANRTLGLKLPNKNLKSGRELRARLEALNIFRAETGHEHFNGCVVFPILAADGTRQIMDVYGRKILGNRLRKGTPLHMHLGEQRRGVWNLEAFGGRGGEIILCPSIFDALTFWCHGFRNVTCMFSKDTVSDDHLAAFKEFNIKRVLTPCEAVTPKLLEVGIDCFLLKFPTDLDANSYVLQMKGDVAAALSAVIRKAEWIGNGKRASGSVAVPPPPFVPVAVAEPAVTTINLPDEDEEDESDELEDTIDTEEDELDDDDVPVSQEAETPPVVQQSSEVNQVATPIPPAPQDMEAEQTSDVRDELVLNIGHRRYRIRGLSKNLSYDIMRINLLASTEHGLFVDTFDLYSARHRKGFVVQAAVELGMEEKVVKKDLGRVLLKLEEMQDEQIKIALTPKEVGPTMTTDEKDDALRLLRDPRLLDRIVNDLPLVGEITNKLVGYLAAVSRKLDQPLAVIIQSSSSAGKTSLMDGILSFVPSEDVVKFSAMTGQSLYYMGDGSLKHKILAIVEEEGAERASYALKLLQSEGELQIASTGKDVSSGRLITQTYRVEGPVMIFLTTTAIKVDEELLNRCLVLTVDEDREQTKAIHRLQRQRQTLQGLLANQEHQRTLTLHRNAQRLLRPLMVANPYAEELTFLDNKTRCRRDHVKYLTLIRTITLLHQYQRPTRTTHHNGQDVQYIEVTLEDIEVANRLASEMSPSASKAATRGRLKTRHGTIVHFDALVGPVASLSARFWAPMGALAAFEVSAGSSEPGGALAAFEVSAGSSEPGGALAAFDSASSSAALPAWFRRR